jgi:hypothetical protein
MHKHALTPVITATFVILHHNICKQSYFDQRWFSGDHGHSCARGDASRDDGIYHMMGTDTTSCSKRMNCENHDETSVLELTCEPLFGVEIKDGVVLSSSHR